MDHIHVFSACVAKKLNEPWVESLWEEGNSSQDVEPHLRLPSCFTCPIVHPASSFEDLCAVYLPCLDISGLTRILLIVDNGYHSYQ
jgi:hypothetical protein